MTAKIFLKLPLVKMAKNYHNAVASLNISMRNLIIITTFSKGRLQTRNYFKSLESPEENLGKTGDEEVEDEVSLGGLEEMEHICQLTNLIANSLPLKPFLEPILTNIIILMIVV